MENLAVGDNFIYIHRIQRYTCVLLINLHSFCTVAKRRNFPLFDMHKQRWLHSVELQDLFSSNTLYGSKIEKKEKMQETPINVNCSANAKTTKRSATATTTDTFIQTDYNDQSKKYSSCFWFVVLHQKIVFFSLCFCYFDSVWMWLIVIIACRFIVCASLSVSLSLLLSLCSALSCSNSLINKIILIGPPISNVYEYIVPCTRPHRSSFVVADVEQHLH